MDRIATGGRLGGGLSAVVEETADTMRCLDRELVRVPDDFIEQLRALHLCHYCKEAFGARCVVNGVQTVLCADCVEELRQPSRSLVGIFYGGLLGVALWLLVLGVFLWWLRS